MRARLIRVGVVYLSLLIPCNGKKQDDLLSFLPCSYSRQAHNEERIRFDTSPIPLLFYEVHVCCVSSSKHASCSKHNVKTSRVRLAFFFFCHLLFLAQGVLR